MNVYIHLFALGSLYLIFVCDISCVIKEIIISSIANFNKITEGLLKQRGAE